MKINPVNIKSQTFSKTFRGYDTTEVKTFLSNLADDLAEILQENVKLKNDLEYHISKNSEYVRIEKNLQEVLLKTQEDSEKALEKAKQEAENIVQKAKEEANTIINEAKAKVDKLNEEIDILENHKKLLLIKLKNFVSLEANLLKTSLNSNDTTSNNEDKIESPKEQ